MYSHAIVRQFKWVSIVFKTLSFFVFKLLTFLLRILAAVVPAGDSVSVHLTVDHVRKKSIASILLLFFYNNYANNLQANRSYKNSFTIVLRLNLMDGLCPRITRTDDVIWRA